ncbi:MAG: hypothetical protein L6R00_00010 [Phycisphaerae bacterium]|nr:hypothetical protein [Phycisphaerae bacterium]
MDDLLRVVWDRLSDAISHSERDASPIAYAHDRANRLTDWAGHAQAYDLAGNVTLAFSAAGDKSYTYGSSPNSGERRADF